MDLIETRCGDGRWMEVTQRAVYLHSVEQFRPHLLFMFFT